MKRKLVYFVSAIMVLAGTGCKKESRELISNEQMPISFVPSTMFAKGAIDGVEFPSDRTFLMSAYHNASEGTSGNFFSNTTFSKVGSTWTADKFWPLSGSLDFFAVSYDGLAVTNKVYQTKVTDGISFTVPDNSSAQVDILHASVKDQSYQSSGTPLVFKHAQSLLIFTAGSTVAYDATKNFGVTISKITVNNAKYEGSLAVTSAEDSEDGCCVWNLSSAATKNKDLPGLTSYNCPTTPMDVSLSGNHFGIGGTGIMVPEQTQTSFTVYFTLHNGKDDDGVIVDNEQQYTYTCSGDWIEGKKYNYKININVNQIEVVPSVTDWVVVNSDVDLPEAVAATYSVNGRTTAKLPKATMAANTEVFIDWGDGTKEGFTNKATKTGTVSGNELTLSHTYSAICLTLISGQ